MRWIQIIRMNEWIQNRMNTNYSDEWMNTEWGEYKWLGWMNEYIMRWIQIILMNEWIQNEMNTND